MEGSKGIVGGGGEVRKLHIVYFLSHGGKIEQPHLVRIHHVHRNGVHLRDVKSWLSNIRGKDMPDSYSWSYKRKYKSGYVWQDLKEDDLITPFSDNEYILKGSELSSKEETMHALTPRTSRKPLRVAVDQGISPKTPSPPDHGSPGTLHPPAYSISDVSEESVGGTAPVIKIDLWKQLRIEQKRIQAEEEGKTTAASSVSSGKRYSDGGGGASYWCWWLGRRPWLRNILSCGAVDTNSSALTVQRPKNDMLVRKGSYKSTTDTARSSVPTNPRKSSKKDGARAPNCL